MNFVNSLRLMPPRVKLAIQVWTATVGIVLALDLLKLGDSRLQLLVATAGAVIVVLLAMGNHVHDGGGRKTRKIVLTP